MSTFIDSIKEGIAEGSAEHAKLTTPISYWCKLFEFQFSPKEFYAVVEKYLATRDVPGLLQEFILLRESTIFSAKRLYLQMRRQRIVFEICAAPFGTGFFVSSRLFDRRREAWLWDYVVTIALLGGIGAYTWIQSGTIPMIVIVGTIITVFWSLMRLGVRLDATWLDDQMTEVPCVGRIYETWFHPDTYFRQDQTHMYREAVHRSLMEAIAEVCATKGVKPPTELESRPILRELDRR